MPSDTLSQHRIKEHAHREFSLATLKTRASEFLAFYERRRAALGGDDLDEAIDAELALEQRIQDLADALVPLEMLPSLATPSLAPVG